MNSYSLFELNALVRRTLSQGLPDEYWLQAEISDVRVTANGHCYLEFIQKDPQKNTIIAKSKGTIWANVFRMLRPYFESTTRQAFVSGIKVLVKVRIEFHELYGYHLSVSNIDPTYTVGDMARRRLEVLKQLEKDGLLQLNKKLPFPTLPQRIAVVSSASAAGFVDFKHQLQSNPKGYYFYTELFPAVMQGDRVEQSIAAALQKISLRLNNFDCVVIIRGGGATSDLSCFDTYDLAALCARFPLPILTGIGHERDDTVLDSVAHIRVKTPTAAAEFLIAKMDEAACILDSYRVRIPAIVYNQVSIAKLHLLTLRKDLTQHATAKVTANKHQLELIKQRIKDVSPENILNKGYSLTLKNGKVVKDASQVSRGDVLTTRLAKNEITSTVK